MSHVRFSRDAFLIDAQETPYETSDEKINVLFLRQATSQWRTNFSRESYEKIFMRRVPMSKRLMNETFPRESHEAAMRNKSLIRVTPHNMRSHDNLRN